MAKKQSRKEKEYERHKEEILSAARSVFAKKGFEKASISEIAKEADFSVGTLYNFFESKKALFDALLNSQVVTIAEQLEEIHNKYENPIERILQQLDGVVKLFIEKMDLLKLWYDIMGMPLSHNLESLPKGVREIEKQSFQRMVDNFSEAISQNLIIMIDPFYLAIAFQGIIYSFIAAYVEDPEKHPLEQTLEDAKTIFFKSILTPKARLNNQKKKN